MLYFFAGVAVVVLSHGLRNAMCRTEISIGRSGERRLLKQISSVMPQSLSSEAKSIRRKRRFDSSTVQYLYDRYVGDDPELIAEFENQVFNSEIARKIYRLRVKAGLSQRELARRVGTTASTISRLEDSDYAGHSLFMLKRIAEALDQRIGIRFVRAKRLKTA